MIPHKHTHIHNLHSHLTLNFAYHTEKSAFFSFKLAGCHEVERKRNVEKCLILFDHAIKLKWQKQRQNSFDACVSIVSILFEHMTTALNLFREKKLK